VLGLLSEDTAEAMMQEHEAALDSAGIRGRGFDLEFGDASARGFWKARTAGWNGLVRTPLRSAAAGLCLPILGADLYIDWVTLTTGGIRLRDRVSNADPKKGWSPS
jgi:hypothetical protein